MQLLHCMAWVHKPRRGADRIWSYPPSADVLEEVGLRPMEEYIRRRHNTIAKWIATRPVFWTCWEGERLPGAPRHQFWWEQEFDLDLEALIDEPRSDDPTASEVSWRSGEVGLGV